MDTRMTPFSKVRVTFEGMLLLFLNDNRESCFVGFLKDIPNHNAEVQITQVPRGGAAEIVKQFDAGALKSRLVLDTNKPNQKVRLYTSSTPPFPRDENSDPRDFRWAVDLEGPEVYDRMLKPGVALDRLSPVLRIFDGMFYSQPPLSHNELSRQRFNETQPVPLGRVAIKLLAEIDLDEGEEATFINGTGADREEVSLPASQDIDYGIYVCNKRTHNAGDHGVDAEHYHDVVAGAIAPSRRVRFDRHPRPHEVTPDAVCLPAWMSRTEE